MARGRTSAHYATDAHPGEPAGFTYKVPDNLYAEADIGWTALVTGEITPPKNFRPRHALGIDAAGKRHKLVVPDPAANIWVGSVTAWDGYANDGTAYHATVTGYEGEGFTRPR